MKNLVTNILKWLRDKAFFIFLYIFLLLTGFGVGHFFTFVSAEKELINQHHINLKEKSLRMHYEVIIKDQQNIIRNQKQTLDSIKKWM